ncbi:putative transposase, partial [Shigella boydii 965-58]
SGLNKTDKEQSKSAKEAWLIFSSTNDFRAREIIKLYSRRMQIEQNFRDERTGASDLVFGPAKVVQQEEFWF